MKVKWLIGAGFVLLVGALIWANLRQSATPASAQNGPKTAPQVKVVRLTRQDLVQRVLAPGTLEATRPREVRAPFVSPHLTLMVGLGDQVAAGQVIAELDGADLKVQAAGQAAQVARAEATLAQYIQQQENAPLQLAQRLESARAQMAQAQQVLESALKQTDTARQRVEQARAALLTVQGRAVWPSDEAAAARQKLQAAEANYRAHPLDPAVAAAYEAARTAYEDALRRSAESARQLSADLAQAADSLQWAERDLEAAGGDDPVAVRQARSQVQSARLALELADREVRAGGLQAEQIRSAEADLAAARVSYVNTRAKLEEAVLRSPSGGTVLTVALKDGQPVQQGQLVVELGSMEVLTVYARVDEIDVGKVRPGQALAVRSNAHAGERFEGRVTRVSAQAAAAQGQAGTYYEVQGEVKNPTGKLRSGMTADARITTETKTGVFVAGLESVREEDDKALALVVREFKVQVREVKLGLRTQTQVEVVAGLQEGDEVIVSPFTLIRSLKDGDPVRVEIADPPSRGDEE